MKKAITILGLASALTFSVQAGCDSPMNNDAFQVELTQVQKHDFDEAKKEAISNILNNCLSSSQIKTLLSELSFEEDKLELAKKAFKNVADPENFGSIKEVFDFDDSKNEIDTLIKQ